MTPAAAAAPARADASTRPVERHVLVLAGLAALVAGAALALTVVQPVALARADWLLIGALAVSCYLLNRHTFVLPWRSHRIAMTADEVLVLLALVTLPLPLAPLVFLPSVALAQLTRRRPWIKAVFNLSQHALGAALAALVVVAARPWMPEILAAALAIAVFNLFSHGLLSQVLARLERGSARRMFLERLLAPSLFQIALGVGAGIILLALWSYHPLSLVVFVPFFVLAREYVAFRVRSERVALIQDRIKTLGRALSRAATPADVADETLAAVGDLLPAGLATLTLQGGRGEPNATWRRSYAASLGGADPLDAPLLGADGCIIGLLRIDLAAPEGAAPGGEPLEPALARLIASEAGAAFDRVRALAAVRPRWSDAATQAFGGR